MVISRCRAVLQRILSESNIFSPSFEAGEIISHVIGRRPLGFEEITEKQFGEMLVIAEKRVQGEPLQYIFGEWEFYGLPFLVGEGVLIPRPETEILVDLAVSACKNGGNILDLCSGTGCIAISASKNTNADVYAVELYDAAFSYLKRNIELNSARVTAIQADALDGTHFGNTSFDIIVSNPPYLTKKEMDELQREVRREPKTALFGGDDGLDFYRRLIPAWKNRLSENGAFAFEVGDEQAQAVADIFTENGFSAGIIPDLQKIGRAVIGKILQKG